MRFSHILQKHYTPKRLALDYSFLEPASLLFLALSFYYGLKRIEMQRNFTALNHQLVDCEEKAIQIAQTLEGLGQTHEVKHMSGKVVSPEELKKQHQKYVSLTAQWESKVPVILGRARRYYKLRDRFLIFGFATIFLAKVLQPYGKDASLVNQKEFASPVQQSPTTIQTNTAQKVSPKPLFKNSTPSNGSPIGAP